MKLSSLLTITGVLMTTMTMTTAGCQALKSETSVTEDAKLPGIWKIQNKKVEISVDASRGRIMHYGFRGGTNVLWTNYEAEKPEYANGGWVNWGGDKIWPWPMDLFGGWPPPEVSYEVRPSDDGKGLVMTSAVVPKISARIVRTIELADDNSSMIVTSVLEPTDVNFGKPMAAWSITQIPTPQSLYVRIALASDRQRYINRPHEGNDVFEAKEVGDRVVKLSTPTITGKTFFDGEVIAAVYPDYVLLQRQLPIQTEGIWLPDQRAQIFSNPLDSKSVPPGYSYFELEWSAPILPPVQVHKAPLRVVYKLVKINKNTTPEQIVQMIDESP